MSRTSTYLIDMAARTRALELAMKFKRSPPTILMYHGVSVEPEPSGVRNWEGKHIAKDLFANHLRILQRSRRVISLSEMVAGLEGRQDMSNTVVLTFDDGYENNVLAAAPMLADFKMPAVVFLVTDFIGKEHCAWFDKLEIALDRTAAATMQLPDNAGVVPIASVMEKRRALATIKRILKAKMVHSLDNEVEQVTAQLGVTEFIPTGDARFMSWSQVQQLSHAGFEVGAHTKTHPILSKIPFDAAVAEILGSKERVVQELGQCSTTFCFPNGKLSDFSPELREMCKQHFKAVLTAERGTASPDELYELKRLSPAGSGKGENVEWMLLRAK